jgi:hypothetical protein
MDSIMAQSGQQKCEFTIERRSRTATLVVLMTAALAAQGAPAYLVRSSNGVVSCVVTQAPDGPQGQSQLAVQVRGPASPTGEILASLPAELRDFSSVPIRIVLLTPPNAGSASVQRLPILFDPSLEHPTIEGAPSADGFARAVFPRAWLVAGATILGERMVVAPNGTRVTSQTRCAITETDAAQWR